MGVRRSIGSRFRLVTICKILFLIVIWLSLVRV